MSVAESQTQTQAKSLAACDQLAARSARLALVVEATSRRRDVREIRARLLLLLLGLRCPPGTRPSKRWYVQGGVARLGVEGIRRAWRGFYGMEPPCERRLRKHLGVLGQALAVVRVPGDWMPGRFDGPRPRFPDTLLVLTSDAEVDWWATVGLDRLDGAPAARLNPTLWRELFGSWRSEAAQRELPFPGPLARRGGATPAPRQLEAHDAALLLARAVRDGQDAHDCLQALARSGARLAGRAGWTLAADPVRARGVCALLGRALWRGDGIRSRGAWVVSAARHAGGRELAQAELWALRTADRHPPPAGARPMTGSTMDRSEVP